MEKKSARYGAYFQFPKGSNIINSRAAQRLAFYCFGANAAPMQSYSADLNSRQFNSLFKDTSLALEALIRAK